jgi:uncharacterized phage-associated protein
MPYDPRFEQKTTEAAALLLKLCGGRVKYIKLLKLLYYADREAFALWERPITYDTYAALDNGPIVSSTYDLIKGNYPQSKFWNNFIVTDGYYVRLKGNLPEIKKLSPAEIDLIEAIFAKYGSLEPFELSKRSHRLPEYREPPEGSSSPIPLAELLIALNYNQDDINRITSEVQEESSITAFFGA